MRKKKENHKADKLVDTLKLPRDICFGDIRISFTGNREAWIENYRGITEYNEQTILLQGKNCQVSFEGIGLSIDYYTNEDMKISGCFACIRFI